MPLPYPLNPLGISAGNPLLDRHTQFLLYGPAGVRDIAKGTAIDNHGLITDGEYICASTSTSYAVIPANALAEDVLCGTHDWTLEIAFKAPAQVTKTGRIFGLDETAPTYRLDVYKLITTGQLGVGGMIHGIIPVPTHNADNYFKLAYSLTNGFTWQVNDTANSAGIDDIASARNTRTRNNAILAKWRNGQASEFSPDYKIKFLRISNIVR